MLYRAIILRSALCTGDGGHDVTAASRPVKAFVPVRIRLVTPKQVGLYTLSSKLCTSLGRAVEYGLSVKREIASGFEPRPSRHVAGLPTRLLSISLIEWADRMQVTASAIWRRSSVVERPAPTREVAGSNPVS